MKKRISIVLLVLLIISLLFNIYQHKEYDKLTQNVQILSYELESYSQKNDRLIAAISELILEEDEITNLTMGDNDNTALDSLLIKIKKINRSIQSKSDSLLAMNEMFRRLKTLRPDQDQKLRQAIDNVEELREMLSIKNVEIELLRTELEQLRKKIQQVDHKTKEIVLTLPDNIKLRYIGELENNKPEGLGVGFYSTGGHYIGQWKDGQRHGQGEYVWSNGDIYRGEYVLDKRHGQGVYLYSNGYRYQGNWSNDLREGYGELLDDEGRILAKGNWKNNKLENKK
ncbi:MAG: hypothetical protein ACK4KT_06995 [Thermaurantimonas sp.]